MKPLSESDVEGNQDMTLNETASSDDARKWKKVEQENK